MIAPLSTSIVARLELRSTINTNEYSSATVTMRERGVRIQAFGCRGGDGVVGESMVSSRDVLL